METLCTNFAASLHLHVFCRCLQCCDKNTCVFMLLLFLCLLMYWRLYFSKVDSQKQDCLVIGMYIFSFNGYYQILFQEDGCNSYWQYFSARFSPSSVLGIIASFNFGQSIDDEECHFIIIQVCFSLTLIFFFLKILAWANNCCQSSFFFFLLFLLKSPKYTVVYFNCGSF